MRNFKRVLVLAGMLLAASSLSACCGPWGHHYCGGWGHHGGYYGHP